MDENTIKKDALGENGSDSFQDLESIASKLDAHLPELPSDGSDDYRHREHYDNPSDLLPGLYAAKIISVRYYESKRTGSGLSFVLDFLGRIEDNSDVSWHRFGRFQKCFQIPTHLDLLVSLYNNLNVLTYDGRYVSRGGDILRCAHPLGMWVHASVRTSSYGGSSFIFKLYPARYQYTPNPSAFSSSNFSSPPPSGASSASKPSKRSKAPNSSAPLSSPHAKKKSGNAYLDGDDEPPF